VRIGVETGNERLRNDVLEKRVSDEAIIRAFRLLREAGIRRWAFNMLGVPFETPTMEDTVRLNRAVDPDTVFCSIFQPYPGTRAAEICRDRGWDAGKTVGSYFEAEYVLNQPSVTRPAVLFYQDIFEDLVRLGPLIKVLSRIKIYRGKSLWNAWRRVRAKAKEFGWWLAGRCRPRAASD
jgi:radical SAM superfamily enzyme YgiQ (UPF0313 family)